LRDKRGGHTRSYKSVLIGFLSLCIVFLLVQGYGYIAFLQNQNSELFRNVNEVAARVKEISLEKTTQDIVDLRGENNALRGEIAALKVDLGRCERSIKGTKKKVSVTRPALSSSPVQEAPPKTREKTTDRDLSKGNRGYLFRK
jgi:exopolysaccharide biosynthesis protein